MSMNKGLFDLSGFENLNESDLMSIKLNESGEEFKDHCPSSDPTQHFDAANSGDKEIPVPGGDKETPSAKPADGEMGPSIPGGDKETPSAKPADGNDPVPNPAKVTLDEDTYNDAMDRLQKSFQEGVELLAFLRNASVVTESVEKKQEQYTESVVGTAILESLENGPLYEKVDRSDKKEVKEIVSNLRDKVAKSLKKDDVFFRVPNYWVHLIVGAVGTLAAGVGVADLTHALNIMFTTRMWQILGICHMESGNIKDLTTGLTEKFSEDLGEYKILAVQVVPTIIDLFKQKFGWKNHLSTYLLLVDKKIPSEIDDVQQALVAEVEKAKGSKDDKKDTKDKK